MVIVISKVVVVVVGCLFKATKKEIFCTHFFSPTLFVIYDRGWGWDRKMF